MITAARCHSHAYTYRFQNVTHSAGPRYKPYILGQKSRSSGLRYTVYTVYRDMKV